MSFISVFDVTIALLILLWWALVARKHSAGAAPRERETPGDTHHVTQHVLPMSSDVARMLLTTGNPNTYLGHSLALRQLAWENALQALGTYNWTLDEIRAAADALSHRIAPCHATLSTAVPAALRDASDATLEAHGLTRAAWTTRIDAVTEMLAWCLWTVAEEVWAGNAAVLAALAAD